MKDYYKTLGVEKNASQDEIKKAFRKHAHQHHPDKKGGDASKFKEVNEAYSVLSDDKKRSQYDTYGSAGPAGAGGGFDQSGFGGFDFSQFTGQAGFGGGDNVEFDIGDIFGSFFGGQRGGRERVKRGRDISIDADLTFSESIFGVQNYLRFPRF
jgi:molecular chaperone DnaJ